MVWERRDSTHYPTSHYTPDTTKTEEAFPSVHYIYSSLSCHFAINPITETNWKKMPFSQHLVQYYFCSVWWSMCVFVCSSSWRCSGTQARWGTGDVGDVKPVWVRSEAGRPVCQCSGVVWKRPQPWCSVTYPCSNIDGTVTQKHIQIILLTWIHLSFYGQISGEKKCSIWFKDN